MKRLLTLNDLYNYYSSTKKSTHFSASEDNENIVVQINGKLNFKKSEKDTEGLREVYLQACHIDENINGSNIKESVMTAALPSFSNRPILGYIHDVDGQPEFYGHNMHMDDDGNVVYDEVPIGVIPESCDAKLVYDKDKDKTYVEVKGYIFEEYSKAAEILEREQECSVSVELSIRELSYDAKNKYLDIEDFFFSGVTILGKNDEGEIVRPGMSGSNIKLADFSKENNSMFSENDKLIEVLEKLNTTLSGFSNINSKLEEGGNETNMFEKLLEKYGKTVEDIAFDYTDLSDEELEAKFAEMFEEAETDTDGSGDEPSNDDEGDNVVDSEDSTNINDNGDSDNNGDVDTNNDDTSTDDIQDNEQFEKIVRSFELSHDDIRYALYNLLAPYEETDNEYYWIMEVFDSYFVYQGYTGKVYGQKYAKDGDNISFDGERYELFMEYLTESEKTTLAEMRSNYAVLKEFKENIEKNELIAQKNELINSEKYAVITEKNETGEYVNEAFAKLISEIDNYSLEELETQIKVIHSDFVAENSNFSTKSEEKKVSQTRLPIQTKSNKKGRYGSLKFN